MRVAGGYLRFIRHYVYEHPPVACPHVGVEAETSTLARENTHWRPHVLTGDLKCPALDWRAVA